MMRKANSSLFVKAPISQERMIYDKENQKVIYKSKHGTIVYEPLDWLAAITSHIPNKYAQSVHFYGRYSNKSRGLRLKAQERSQGNSAISYVPPPPKKACNKKWAELIKLVYEVNPLLCCEILKLFEPSMITEDVASFRRKSQEQQE